MGVANLARVWAPTLLQSPFGEQKAKDDIQNQIKVQFLYVFLYFISDIFMLIYHSSLVQ